MSRSLRWDALRIEFLARSINELTELSAALAGDVPASPFEQMRSVIHRIAGTGFTLDFQMLAEQARSLENRWRLMPAADTDEAAELSTDVRKLLEICHAHSRRMAEESTF